MIPPSDSDSSSRAQVVGEAAAVSSVVAAAAAVASSEDNEQETTPSTPSDRERELEHSTEARTRTEEMISDQRPLINVTSEPESEPNQTTASTAEQTPQEGGSSAAAGEDLEVVPNASPAIGELGRQSTIVRASGLLSEDRDAAVRARQRARSRSQIERDARHRKNTDELTNERKCDDHLPYDVNMLK